LQKRGLAAVLDAHYFYPDGVAAAWIGERLRIPVVITARGSDVNVVARHAVPRRLILWAARRAAAIVTVSESLRAELIRLGVPEHRIRTLRNGVDLEKFSPGDQAASRSSLGLSRLTLLSVGRLVGGKGHSLVVEALRALPAWDLVIAGDGPQRAGIEELAAKWGLGGRVRLTGALTHASLIDYYRAADVLVLASASEGMPNVVLEAMACGTPVVASAVGGIPEILAPGIGRIVSERTPAAIAAAIRELEVALPDRIAVRGHAEGFGWGETIESLALLLEGLTDAGRSHQQFVPRTH
jgi:glycosyltransferase involved in cell wall biosynthesis